MNATSSLPPIQEIKKSGSKYVIEDGDSLSRGGDDENEDDYEEKEEGERPIEQVVTSKQIDQQEEKIVNEEKNLERSKSKSKSQKKVTIVETTLQGNHNYIPDEETTENNEDIGNV